MAMARKVNEGIVSRVTILTIANAMNNQPLFPPDEPCWTLILAAWMVATMSTLGALFIGEIMHLPTCNLCWYQRIFMFPLALLLPVGLFPLDRRVVRYALPLAVTGGLIAVFHQLLVAGVIPERIKPCTQGVPCSEMVIEWFGFVTIPLLSLAAFATIIALLFVAYSRGSK